MLFKPVIIITQFASWLRLEPRSAQGSTHYEWLPGTAGEGTGTAPSLTGAGAGTADGSLLTGVAPSTGNASGPGPGAAGLSAPA